jgi:hypothetical protein
MFQISLHANAQGTGNGNGTAHAPTSGAGSGFSSGSGSGSRHKIALENMFTPPSEREIKALFDGMTVGEDRHDGHGHGHSHGHAQSGPVLGGGLKASPHSQPHGVNGAKWDVNGMDEHGVMEKNYDSSVQCREPAESYTDIESGNQAKEGNISTYFWNLKSYFSRTKKNAKVSFSYNTKGN